MRTRPDPAIGTRAGDSASSLDEQVPVDPKDAPVIGRLVDTRGASGQLLPSNRRLPPGQLPLGRRPTSETELRRNLTSLIREIHIASRATCGALSRRTSPSPGRKLSPARSPSRLRPLDDAIPLCLWLAPTARRRDSAQIANKNGIGNKS